METNKEEALKAKENAEKRFSVQDYSAAKSFASKAQTLFPELDGISQMVTTFEVYVASEKKINGEVDFYSVLGVKPSADRSMIKKRYKKLAVSLHPDKNKTVGADGAFKLVSEAWTLLSDPARRASYDFNRNNNNSIQLPSMVVTCPGSAPPPSFWTVCTSCQVQYEYLRKYVNKRLSCKNCRATFIAEELGTAPIDGSYTVSWSSSYGKDSGYGGHGYNGASYFPNSGLHVQGQGKGNPGYHSGSNMSFQWGACPGTSSVYADPNGYTNGYVSKPGKKVKASTGTVNNLVADGDANGSFGYNGAPAVKTTRPYKKRKVELSSLNGHDVGQRYAPETGVVGNGSGIGSPKFPGSHDLIPSPLDARYLLIKKARTGIQKKLEEMKAASAEKKKTLGVIVNRFAGARRKLKPSNSDLEPQRTGPITLVVPDPDFHDFDKDRTEECFKPKQIWAIYDEEDGMPRLYCLIRQIISENPFKMHISYLSSKSDNEFGLVNWISSGFTKSCGHFRAFNSDVVDQVNMFSHLLPREKAGRGGFVKIYPRRGEVWAVYRNWSPEWNRATPYEERHQYDMVEVLDYSEELGVSVVPLVKLDGFKTVYHRTAEKDTTGWVPRREMVRFSHQVPSWLLKEEKDLPEGCWDLDPAATPDELLSSEVKVEDKAEEEKQDTL
ncbi:hypothetical protein V2J09_000118 [Rumex salicifolius]